LKKNVTLKHNGLFKSLRVFFGGWGEVDIGAQAQPPFVVCVILVNNNI
jgi:hypothetical protein